MKHVSVTTRTATNSFSDKKILVKNEITKDSDTTKNSDKNGLYQRESERPMATPSQLMYNSESIEKIVKDMYDSSRRSYI